jgi:hypothetical protein
MSTDFKNSDDYKKIFLFHDSIEERITSRESGWIEFKESFNWGSKDEYAKSIAAFANNKGGYIVFGVKDKPRDLIGLQSNNFDATDEAKITAYLNSSFAPEIIFEKFVISIKTKTVGILHIHKAQIKPIVCLKNDGKLKEADIYYRYNARSEKIKYPELKTLFDLIKEEERRCWMTLMEKISKIGPTNAAIMDILGGEITGTGRTLVVDKKLIPKLRFINRGSFQEGGKPTLKLIGDVKPITIFTRSFKNSSLDAVQITDDPNAPTIRVEEEKILKENYPFNYKDLVKTLSERYVDFKQDPSFHTLRKEFVKNRALATTRYLDPGNPKSSKKVFYSSNIVKKFDQHYTIKK